MKNIILLITDTFRRDNLDGGSSSAVRTPELQRFRTEKAADIKDCFTASFPTIPHRTDLASGRLGWPHYGWQPIDRSTNNHIATLLREQGYATQLICDCPHLFRSNFQHSFDAAYQHRGQEGDTPLLHLNDPVEEVVPVEKTRYRPHGEGRLGGHTLVDLHRWTNRYFQCEEETFAARTASTAVRWLEENHRAGPFFLWVDFFDPHEPWDAPEYMARRYDPDYSGTPMLHPNYGPADDYTAEELNNLRAHYAAEAELVDRHLGRILQKVGDLDLWEDTVLVVTSDHGISLGEHGRTGKSNINPRDERFWPIYPEIGHVPLLIAAEGVEAGREVRGIVQPPDILPTLSDLAGVRLDYREEPHGESFAPTLRGIQEGAREYAVSGSFVDPAQGGPPAQAVTPFVRTEKWGYAPVGAGGEPELYDLSSDPGAEENVALDHGSVLSELHELLLEHLHTSGASDRSLELWAQD